MVSEITDKDYVTIKIPKRTGPDGIKKVMDYI